ncbi:MAG: CBS domain-containing protein [Candidatus Aenigmatarchaeota archaeon]
MLVKDVMNKNCTTCGPDDMLSKVIVKMVGCDVHQIPVIATQEDKNHGKGDVIGMLHVNSIVTREVDPANTKVSSLMKSTPKLTSHDDINRAIELIIDANVRAIPVFDRGLVGIISEQDVLKTVEAGGRAVEYMTECEYISENDKLGKVKDMILHKNISRIPVIENGHFVGIVGTLNLLKVLQPGKQKYGGRGSTGQGYSNAFGLDVIPVTNFIEKPIVVGPDTSMRRVIELLKKNEEVLVENGVYGIITPKDVLRKLVRPTKQALFQIIGLNDEEDVEIVARLQIAISNFIKSIAKSVEVQPMKIHIKKIRTQSDKINYAVNLELPTSAGRFVSTKSKGEKGKTYGDLITITQNALTDLERQIRRKIEEFRRTDRNYISAARARRGK